MSDPSTSKAEAASAETPASLSGPETSRDDLVALLKTASSKYEQVYEQFINAALLSGSETSIDDMIALLKSTNDMYERFINENNRLIAGYQAALQVKKALTPKDNDKDAPEKPKDSDEAASEFPASTDSGKATPASTDPGKTITAQMGNMNLTDSLVAAGSQASIRRPKTSDSLTLYGIRTSVYRNQPDAMVHMTPTLLAAMERGEIDFRRNPDFAAAAPGITSDEVNAMVADDFDRGERGGDPGKRLCVGCEEACKRVCGGCKHASYCSRECQVADWPVHKKLCKDFAGHGADDKRPSPEHRRILFFPLHSSKPELQWIVPTEEKPDDPFVFFHLEHPDVDLFVAEVAQMGLGTRTVLLALQLKPILANRCGPYSESLFDIADPKFVNQSISGLGTPGYCRALFGPVAVFVDARRHGSTGPPQILDFGPRDLTTFYRYYISYDCVCVTDVGRYFGEVISGLRISDPKNEMCAAMGVKAVMDPVSVPLSPGSSHTDYPMALAFLLGLRWYIRPGLLKGIFGNSCTLWSDGNLRYMAYTLDIKEVATSYPKNGEEPSYEYQVTSKYGPFAASVFILHGSGNPVDKYHVLAFNAYLDEMYVKKEMPSKKGFQKYWFSYKAAAGGPVSSVPSPYKWEKPDVKDKLGLFNPAAVMQLLSKKSAVIWKAIMPQVNSFNSGDFQP